jgi:hypothetical protein
MTLPSCTPQLHTQVNQLFALNLRITAQQPPGSPVACVVVRGAGGKASAETGSLVASLCNTPSARSYAAALVLCLQQHLQL